jgi:hypothetical protein
MPPHQCDDLPQQVRALPSTFTVLEMYPPTMATKVLARGGDEDFGGATGAALVGATLDKQLL